MYKVQCGKCNGKGIISMYRGIMGGVCFNCNGKGYKIQKAKPTVSNKYCIGATDKETKEVTNRIFWIKAKSEKQALEKAIEKLSKGKGYIAETAFVYEKEETKLPKFEKIEGSNKLDIVG